MEPRVHSRRLKNGAWNVPVFYKILYRSCFLAAVIRGMLPSYSYHIEDDCGFKFNLPIELRKLGNFFSAAPGNCFEKDVILLSKPR